MRTTIGHAVLAPVMLVLSACSGTPGCSDAKTVELVLRGFTQRLDALLVEDKVSQQLVEQFRPTLQASVNTITVTATDEKIKKNSCAGVLEVKLPASAVKVLSDEELSRVTLGKAPSELLFKVKDGVASINVKYTAQTTEDTKKLVVELRGHDPLADALSRLASYGAMDPTGKALSLPPMAHTCKSADGIAQLTDLFRDTLAERGKAHGLSADFITNAQRGLVVSVTEIKTVKSAPDLSDFYCTGTLQIPVSDETAKVFKEAGGGDQVALLAMMAAVTQPNNVTPQEVRLLREISRSSKLLSEKAITDDFKYRSYLSEDKKVVNMYAQGFIPALDLYLAVKVLEKGPGNAGNKQ